MHSYLSHRKQRTKVNHTYSSWDEILFDVPQSSILGPILFNIFLSDLFFVISNTDFSSYADDNTIYDSGNSIDDVISSLQESGEKLFQWFSHSQMKRNTDKCPLIVSTDEPIEIRVSESLIKSSPCEKLLVIKIDNKLNFDTHVKGLCTKANNKLRALARATSYMSLEKKKLLMNSFFNAQFNYCPLTWMLHSRSNNNKIKHLHERCLRIIYNDKQSSYEELLIKDGTVSIRHRNIQTLATEMFKVKNELSPEIICDIFMQRINNHYNLRHINHFETPFVRTVYNGTESVSYLGPKIWDIVPEEYKTLNSLNSFKESIKNWIPLNCPCRLCKTYVHGVDFLEG